LVKWFRKWIKLSLKKCIDVKEAMVRQAVTMGTVQAVWAVIRDKIAAATTRKSKTESSFPLFFPSIY
jgi:hypothetical protein